MIAPSAGISGANLRDEDYPREIPLMKALEERAGLEPDFDAVRCYEIERRVLIARSDCPRGKGACHDELGEVRPRHAVEEVGLAPPPEVQQRQAEWPLGALESLGAGQDSGKAQWPH